MAMQTKVLAVSYTVHVSYGMGTTPDIWRFPTLGEALKIQQLWNTAYSKAYPPHKETLAVPVEEVKKYHREGWKIFLDVTSTRERKASTRKENKETRAIQMAQ